MRKKGEIYYTFGIMIITLLLIVFTYSALIEKIEKSTMVQGNIVQNDFLSTYLDAELDSLKYESQAKLAYKKSMNDLTNFKPLCGINSDNSYIFSTEDKKLDDCFPNYQENFEKIFKEEINKNKLFNHTYIFHETKIAGTTTNTTIYPITIEFLNEDLKNAFTKKINLDISKELNIKTKKNQFLLGTYEFKPDFTIEIFNYTETFTTIYNLAKDIEGCTTNECIDKEISKIPAGRIYSEYLTDINKICQIDVDKADKTIKFCAKLPPVTYVENGFIKQENPILKYAVFVPNLEP